LDKLDKIGRDGVVAELSQRGVAETSAAQLLDIIARPSDAGPTASLLTKQDPRLGEPDSVASA
jgi:hypothetical protein